MAQVAATGKFVDAAALRALEGKPSDSSVGNWNWLRRRANSNTSNAQSPAVHKDKKDSIPPPPSAQDLSPNDRPIVIGISLPEGDLVGRTVSPHTATLETPMDMFVPRPAQTAQTVQTIQPSGLQQVAFPATLSPEQIKSVWSPDTDEGSPYSARASTSRATSSVYSHYYSNNPNNPNNPNSSNSHKDVSPPVPSLPSAYRDVLGLGLSSTTAAAPPPPALKKLHKDTLLDDYDDADTPITLFEEDGSPVSYRRISRLARANTNATTATRKTRRSLAPTIDTTHSGWWDHVQTPFNEQAAASFAAFTPTSKVSPLTPGSATSPLAREYIPAVPAVPVVPAVPTLAVPAPKSTSPAPALSATPASFDSAPSLAPSASTPALPSPTEWWKTAEEKRSRSASPPLSTSKPALGISTAVANAHAYPSAGQASPTVASSSRAAPVQRLTTPRLTPGHTPGHTPSEAPPPPYEPPSKPEMAVRYRAVFPPGHPLRGNFPPSPGPMSPGLAHTMTSQGAIYMADVPLTPAGARSAAAAAGMPFPDRPSGALLPGTTIVASRAAAKVERTRRRHEKEDAAGRRADNFWRGRGCMPTRGGLFGRNQNGRESRKRRRLICLTAFGSIALVITLIVVLVTVLKHKTSSSPKTAYSFWLNTTDFPPIPTGVTAVGTENTQNKNGCVAPSTLWSCSLPKEQQAANAPYASDAPSFFLDIQFDNSAAKRWDVADGAIPTPSPSFTGTVSSTASTQQFDASFTPSPSPPTFQEMWFLGNTTDDIVSDRKAGEPTPFYITFLSSVNGTTAGPNEVTRRGVDGKRAESSEASSDAPSSTSTSASAKKTTSSKTSTAATTNAKSSTSTSKTAAATTTAPVVATTTTAPTISGTAADGFPSPSVQPDGTGAPAVMHPQPVQQPLRLYDRGLDTEHYGFYAYFDKTIYVQSIDPSSSTGLASDASGGSKEVDANHVVTWLQTRFLVQIWTRMQNTTLLLSPKTALALTPANATQPGTFPYPITVTEDLHGGDFSRKGVYARLMSTKQEILLTNSSGIVDNLSFGGALVNHGTNPTFGGSDGGSGGCKCVWNNFIGLNGNVIGS